MKRVDKRFLGLFLLGILIISLVVGSIEFVSADPLQDIAKSLGDIATKLGDLKGFNQDPGQEGNALTKFLLFFLVFLITFAIANSMPILKDQKFMGFLISVVLAVLSTIYLKNETINSILVSYESWGILVTVLLPFVFFFWLSRTLFTGAYSGFSRPAWIAFGVILIFRYFIGYNEMDALGRWGYPITIALVLIMLLWEKELFGLIEKEKVKSKFKNYAQETFAQMFKRKMDSKSVLGSYDESDIWDPVRGK